MAPTVLEHLEARTKEGSSLIESSVHPSREAIDQEVLRMVLRESLQRYRNELMEPDEREEVCSRICRLRERLGLA